MRGTALVFAALVMLGTGCDWGVDGIITNDVRRAVELLKEDDEAG